MPTATAALRGLLHCVACCTAWPATLRGLCSKAEKKKTLAQWETLIIFINRSAGCVPVFPTPLVPRTPILSGLSPAAAAEQEELPMPPPLDTEVTLACAWNCPRWWWWTREGGIGGRRGD